MTTDESSESRNELRNRVVSWESAPREINSSERGTEEGATMDRTIQRTWWRSRIVIWITLTSLFAGVILYFLLSNDFSRKLILQKDKITISTVTRGHFQEFISVRGIVKPIRTVFLDAQVGGRVDQIFHEEGSVVKRGGAILRLSNPDLELSVMNQEASIYQQINYQQNTLIILEQGAFALVEQLSQIEHRIQQEKRLYLRNSKLWKIQAISREEYEESKSNHEFWSSRGQFMARKVRQDSVSRATQIRQVRASVEKLEANLQALRRNLEALVVSAPITGQLTSLDAEIGALKSKGQRLGRVDSLDGFKVRAGIDEFYIHRVQNGQSGSCTILSEEYDLVIRKVYPEVLDSRFTVDLEFTSEMPPEMRRGQTLQIRLKLGYAEEALLFARGAFYQATGGNWAFVIDPSGDVAVRREIRIGRHNPEHFEVVGGLEPGDRIITSSYEHFRDIDRLILQD